MPWLSATIFAVRGFHARRRAKLVGPAVVLVGRQATRPSVIESPSTTIADASGSVHIRRHEQVQWSVCRRR